MCGRRQCDVLRPASAVPLDRATVKHEGDRKQIYQHPQCGIDDGLGLRLRMQVQVQMQKYS